jgi:hypothetical protein
MCHILLHYSYEYISLNQKFPQNRWNVISARNGKSGQGALKIPKELAHITTWKLIYLTHVFQLTKMAVRRAVYRLISEVV